MSFVKRRAPIVAVTDAYLARHAKPYLPSQNYRTEIERLARKLSKIHNSDPDRIDSYVYLYEDTRKPGSYEYVCPSGFVLRTKYPVFYVGKGVRARMNSHVLQARNTTRTGSKVDTIRAIWRAGLEPRIVVTPFTGSNDFMCALEIDLIAGIGRKDKGLGQLTNKTDGGDATQGLVHTEAAKELMRRTNLGRKHTIETRARMSAAGKGRVMSAEHIAKIAAALTGKPKVGLGAKGIPKAASSNQKNRETNRRRAAVRAALPDIECDVCGFTGRLLISHFTNCRGKKYKDIPDKRSRSILPSVACPHCDVLCRGVNFIDHFGNCAHAA